MSEIILTGISKDSDRNLPLYLFVNDKSHMDCFACKPEPLQ